MVATDVSSQEAIYKLSCFYCSSVDVNKYLTREPCDIFKVCKDNEDGILCGLAGSKNKLVRGETVGMLLRIRRTWSEWEWVPQGGCQLDYTQQTFLDTKLMVAVFKQERTVIYYNVSLLIGLWFKAPSISQVQQLYSYSLSAWFFSHQLWILTAAACLVLAADSYLPSCHYWNEKGHKG